MEETSNAGSLPSPQRFFSKARLGKAMGLGVVAATLYTFCPRSQPFPFAFEIAMRSSLSGFAQLYWDVGSGVNEKDSVRLPVQGGNRQIDYKFPLAEGRYSYLRFDPTDRARNTMTLVGARIVDRSGNLIRMIPPSQFKPSQEIEQLDAHETKVTLTTAAAATDPILKLDLEEPVILKSYARPSFRKLLRRFLISFLSATLALLAGGAIVARIRPTAARLTTRASAWARGHPAQLLLAAAAASVTLSCYPVVFLGKSFLSPNNHSHTYLLYGEMPTVPGSYDVGTDDEKGSDLGAAMWYSWPTSVVESRALFKHFELPLWNRYDSCGLPLLGQGQSMFGDPLHFLVLLANGASGWWDIKYLLAKFLFAASLGFCVLQLTRHLPAAIIVALSSPFIGFFAFRYSHPAFFSLCYAPFILLCWFKFIDAPKGRWSALWPAMMVLANWMTINSGTVKEAYILLLTMNLGGCLTLLFATTVEAKVEKLWRAFFAQFLFVLISTPIWLTFLLTLRNSWTVYASGGAFQIQPSLFVGLFDDIFYRQFNADEQHFNPSSNFLVLLGVMWFCFSQRRADPDKLSWGLSITCLIALAFAFGIVPSALIRQLPFLGNIYHIDNTLSCVAIVCLLLLSGFGIKFFWNDSLSATFRQTYLRVMVCFAGLLGLYLGTTQAVQRSLKAFLSLGEPIQRSAFFWTYSALLVIALVILPWIGRLVIKGHRVRRWHALALALVFILLHWRHGMHARTPFDAYVMNPQPRANLVAQASPALKLINSSPAEPSRSAGLDYNLAPGYGGAIGVELIDSADPLLNKHYKSLLDVYGAKLLFGSSTNAVIEHQLEDDLPLFNMLNVRYFLGNDPGTKAERISSLKKIAALDLNVYESQKVWPRAFFADRLVIYESENDFARLLREGDGGPFAAVPQSELDAQGEIAALSQDLTGATARRIVAATDYVLTTNKTSFKIAAPTQGVVVLTEPYVAGDFQLKVNGEPATYFRINSAFRGVFLPKAGDYHFSFAYWPRHLTISLWIAGFGIILLVLWLGNAFKSSDRAA